MEFADLCVLYQPTNQPLLSSKHFPLYIIGHQSHWKLCGAGYASGIHTYIHLGFCLVLMLFTRVG
jgi:hypothetical protein